jgi:adenosylcobinamide amidohydrolase
MPGSISLDSDGARMNWDVLLRNNEFELRRRGRMLIAELAAPHRVLSTSLCNGGQTTHVRFLLNHQSCEGTGHHERFREIIESGNEGYHERVCSEAGVPPAATAMMGTAANMNYAAVVTRADGDVTVTAVVTAGVEGNATCAGDPARWRETPAGMERVPEYAGTINTMLLSGVPLTAAALARAVGVMTEGKSAALQRLAVPSRQSPDLATGTGTDQYCVAAPLEGSTVFTSTSSHVKLGELIGVATRGATQEALRWQNGLEPSYTRGVVHALARYGITDAALIDDIRALLNEHDFELFQKNSRAALYEPLVGAAAHALATVLDRIRHGSLPTSIERDACAQHAALLAANLAVQPARWPEFRARLLESAARDPKALILAALALGWSEKWRST